VWQCKESCSNVISVLFSLQNVITANLDRVYMKVVAEIPRLDSNANAIMTILGTDAIVSSLLLCILN